MNKISIKTHIDILCPNSNRFSRVKYPFLYFFVWGSFLHDEISQHGHPSTIETDAEN